MVNRLQRNISTASSPVWDYVRRTFLIKQTSKLPTSVGMMQFRQRYHVCRILIAQFISTSKADNPFHLSSMNGWHQAVSYD